MQGPFEASCGHTRAPTINQHYPIETPKPRPQKWCQKTFTNQVPPKRASIVEPHRPNHQLPNPSLNFLRKPNKIPIDGPIFWSAWRTQKWARETCDIYFPFLPQKTAPKTRPPNGLIFRPANSLFNLVICNFDRCSFHAKQPCPAQWRPMVREPVFALNRSTLPA